MASWAATVKCSLREKGLSFGMRAAAHMWDSDVCICRNLTHLWGDEKMQDKNTLQRERVEKAIATKFQGVKVKIFYQWILGTRILLADDDEYYYYYYFFYRQKVISPVFNLSIN